LFTPRRASAKVCSNRCRQARFRRLHRKPRWQVLPPEGQGECDYNPEFGPAFPDDTERALRRNAAICQMREARRLATKYALLRPGTQPNEINATRRREILSAISALNRLYQRLYGLAGTPSIRA